MAWYYAESGQRFGPFEQEEFDQLVAQGRVGAKTLIWREGMADWMPYGQLDSAGAATLTQTAESACSQCGRPFSTEDMIQYQGKFICANCKEVFFQRVREGARATDGEFVYAGFWIRFGAVLIDGVILWFLGFLLAQVQAAVGTSPSINLMITILNYAIAVSFETFFIGKYGATPGKMACKLKVLVSDGSKVGYGRAFGRYFAKILSGMILAIGYIMAAFDSQKRALHDHICNTRVIRL